MTYLDPEENEHLHISRIISEYEDAISKNKQYLFDQDTVEQIIDFYEMEGMYDKALAVVDRSLHQFPYSSFLLVKKAQLLFDLKMCGRALKYLEKAEVYDPSETGIQFLRAEIYAFQSQYEKAVAILTELRNMVGEEEMPDLLLQLADVYEEWERFEDLHKVLVECLELEPENEEALNRICYSTELSERHEESVRLHLKITDDYPFNHTAWYNLSLSYAGMGLLEKAVEAMEYALAINEELDFAYRELANFHMEMGRYDKAMDAIDAFKDLAGETEDTYLMEGKCYQELGDNKMARELYREALESWPGNALFYSLIAETYTTEENWKAAKKAYYKAASHDKDNYDHWLSLSWAALEDKDFDTVFFASDKCLEIDEQRYDAFYITAQAKFICEEFDQSLSILNSGLVSTREAIELLYAKAALLIVMGKRKEGEQLLRTALSVDNSKFKAFYTFAPILEDDSSLLDIVQES